MAVAVLCALGAALLYATASVLQQRTAAAAPSEQSMRIGLLTRLVRNPVWLLGIGADVAGFVLQLIALSSGTLVLVQPLLVVGLLFALPIGARVNRTRMGRRQWLSAFGVCAGLAVFQSVADPSEGRDVIAASTWVWLGIAAAGLTGALTASGMRARGRAKAVLLSAATGTTYGVASGLIKTVGHLLSVDAVRAFADWEIYTLAAVGIGGMLLAQSAFQAGALDVSLPTMTAVDPVVSILIGALAFGERISAGGWAIGAEVVSLIVMVAGVYGLTRSRAEPASEHMFV